MTRQDIDHIRKYRSTYDVEMALGCNPFELVTLFLLYAIVHDFFYVKLDGVIFPDSLFSFSCVW